MLESNIVAFAIFPLSQSALAGSRHVAVQIFQDIHSTAKNMSGLPIYKLKSRVEAVIIPNASVGMCIRQEAH